MKTLRILLWRDNMQTPHQNTLISDGLDNLLYLSLLLCHSQRLIKRTRNLPPSTNKKTGACRQKLHIKPPRFRTKTALETSFLFTRYSPARRKTPRLDTITSERDITIQTSVCGFPLTRCQINIQICRHTTTAHGIR